MRIQRIKDAQTLKNERKINNSQIFFDEQIYPMISENHSSYQINQRITINSQVNSKLLLQNQENNYSKIYPQLKLPGFNHILPSINLPHQDNSQYFKINQVNNHNESKQNIKEIHQNSLTKVVQLQNFISNKTCPMSMPSEQQFSYGDIGCSKDFCMASKVNKPCYIEYDSMLAPQKIKEEANLYLQEYYRENKLEGLNERISQVYQEIDRTGTYYQTSEELSFGAKTAWRNASRCVLRIQWQNLNVIDRRNCTTNQEMYDAIIDHLKFTTNGGSLLSTMSVFPPKSKDNDGPRLFGDQIFRFACYQNNDGTYIGDQANLELTNYAISLGWKPPQPQTHFDMLPLIIQAHEKGEVLMKEIPEECIIYIKISHDKYKEAFDQMNLKWYHAPALSTLVLEIGGIEYTACPFNGWYMSTEIAMRNFTDSYRYNLSEKLSRLIGWDVQTNLSLWREKSLNVFNEAVLQSFNKARISIVDQFTASESFMQFFKKDQKQRGFVTADWIWLVPPGSGSATEMFHQEMPNFYIKPSYKVRNKNLTQLIKRANQIQKNIRSNGTQQQQKLKITKPYEFQTNNQLQQENILIQNDYNFQNNKYQNNYKEIKEYKVQIPQKELQNKSDFINTQFQENQLISPYSPQKNKTKPFISIYFASETGTAEQFYENILTSELQNFVEMNGELNQLDIENWIQQKSKDKVPKWLLIISSTFGKGEAPKNGKLFEQQMKKIKINKKPGSLKWAYYSVFAVGNSNYEEFFVKFPKEVDQLLNDLGMNQIEKITIADEKTGQKQPFNQWKQKILSKLELNQKKIESLKIQEVQRPSISKQQNQCIFLSSSGNENYRTFSFKILNDQLKNYYPGDYLTILPKNQQNLVNFVYEYFNIQNPQQTVKLNKQDLPSQLKGILSYKEIFEQIIDLHCPPTEELIKEFIEEQQANQMIKDYYKYVQNEYPTPIRILQMSNPQQSMNKLNKFIEYSQIIKPRFYSISSFNKIQNEVSIFATKNIFNKKQIGACSNYLWNLKQNEQVQYNLHQSVNFQLKSYSLQMNIIMIATGSGIGPILAFLEFIDQQKQIIHYNKYDKKGKVILIYGTRRQSDIIMERTINKYLQNKTLDAIYIAFSQEQNQPKKYVQHIILENWNYLIEPFQNANSENSKFFVCGSLKMGRELQELFKNAGLQIYYDIY